LNRVENTEYSQATTCTVVYTQEYPITLHMVGIGQMSSLNAHCLPIVGYVEVKSCLSSQSHSY